MASIVASGTVDLGGVVRPMTFVPRTPGEDPHRRHPGTAERRRTSATALDGYLELAWHNDERHKIAAGTLPQRRPGVRTIVGAATRIGKAAIRQTTVPR